MTYRAGSVPIRVIAIATPHGLIRVISRFEHPCNMIREGLAAIGHMQHEFEWTAYTYSGFPSYMPGVDTWDGDCGVYMWDWLVQTPYGEEPGTYWEDPERRVTRKEPKLLFVPAGWINTDTKRHRVKIKGVIYG